jgi:hypothetical protein
LGKGYGNHENEGVDHEIADDVESVQGLVDVRVPCVRVPFDVRCPFDVQFPFDVQYLVVCRLLVELLVLVLVFQFPVDVLILAVERFLVVCRVPLPFRPLFGKLQYAGPNPAAFLLPECESDLLFDGRKGHVVVRVERYDLVELQIPERVVGLPYVFGVQPPEGDAYDPYQGHVVDRYLVGVDGVVGVRYDHDVAAAAAAVAVAADVVCEYAGRLRSEDLGCLAMAESGEKVQ